MAITVRAMQNDTLDLLCWRHFGSSTASVVESALELNRNALNEVAILQHGQLVMLPDPPNNTAPAEKTLSLWD